MPSRYEFLDTLKTKSGIEFFKSFPCIVLTDDDLGDDVYIIEWKSGNRLDKFAHKFYNDGTLWWVIALVNNIRNPLDIKIGTQIKIPMSIGNILLKLQKASEE